MTEEIKENYYEILCKIENFIDELKSLETAEELENLATRMKSYIFSQNKLKDYFIKNVDLILTLREDSDKLIQFYNDFEKTYIHSYKQSPKIIGHSFLSVPSIFYYSIVGFFYKNDRETPLGVVGLYRFNHADNELFDTYGKEILNSLDFYILSQISRNYLYEFFESNFKDVLALDYQAFNVLWFKSVLKGVLHKFAMYISNDCIPDYYNQEFKFRQERQRILIALKNETGYDEIIKILNFIINIPAITQNQLLEKVYISESTLKNRYKTFLKISRVNIHNEKNKSGLNKVKEIINKYHFTLEDIKNIGNIESQ